MLKRMDGPTLIITRMKKFGTIPCFALGAQTPPPLILDFSFFLLLILAPAGPSPNRFPDPAEQPNLYLT